MNRCSSGNRLPKFMKAGSSHLAIVTFLVCIPFLAGKLADLKLRHYRCLFFYEITFRNFPRIGHVDLGVEKTFTFPGLLLPTFLRQSHHPFRFSLSHASLGVCRLCGLISMRLPPNGKFLVKCCSLPDSCKK